MEEAAEVPVVMAEVVTIAVTAGELTKAAVEEVEAGALVAKVATGVATKVEEEEEVVMEEATMVARVSVLFNLIDYG